MKALVYNGARDVSINDVDDARIERPTDALVQIVVTNICGSDLHMYEGRTEMESGRVLGHENLGRVIEVGSAVDRVRKGDLVCLPFNIGCGFCENCERGLTGFCLTCNPGTAGAAYGFAGMGPYSGGQAELLRVPYADFNSLVLPPDAEGKLLDYVMLSDIWPTGWHATELAGLKPGESILIYGAGPVGLMAAYSAKIKGASQIMVVDRHPDRLKLVEKMGATPISDANDDAIEQVMEQTKGVGADRGCECVGYQCHDHHGHECNHLTMNALVEGVRATGGIGTIGVFVPSDPKAPTELEKSGKMAFDFGKFWFKGQKIGTGQANVKAYNRYLARLIEQDWAEPSFIVSHDLPLDQAPDAYRHFDARGKGWTKVVLRTGA